MRLKMTDYESTALEILTNGKISGRGLRHLIRYEIGLIRAWTLSAPKFYAMMWRLENQGMVTHEDVWKTIVTQDGDHWVEQRIKERFYTLNPILIPENQ